MCSNMVETSRSAMMLCSVSAEKSLTGTMCSGSIMSGRRHSAIIRPPLTMPPKLKTVFRPLGHTRLLQNGCVRPQGFELEYEDVPVLIQAFRRMVRSLEFDVCELA